MMKKIITFLVLLNLVGCSTTIPEKDTAFIEENQNEINRCISEAYASKDPEAVKNLVGCYEEILIRIGYETEH